MLVKKFKSETFEEALREVKREMGPEAIILSKKVVREPNKGVLGLLGKPAIELTAAIDSRLKQKSGPEHILQGSRRADAERTRRQGLNIERSATGKNVKDIVSLSGAAASLNKKNSGKRRKLNKKYIEIDEGDDLDSLISEAERKEKVKLISPVRTAPAIINKTTSIKEGDFTDKNAETIIESLSDPTVSKTPKSLKKLCLNLTLSGVESKFVQEIVNDVTENMNPLLVKRENYLECYAAKFLMDRMKFSDGVRLNNHGPRVAIILGPAGVGKTTSIAKIAAGFKKEGKKVGVISLDVHKIGAIEQLKVFSNILKFPLKVITDGVDLSQAVTEMRDRDIILVDTTGRGKKDSESLAEMKKIFNLNIPVEKHLCLAASMRDSDVMSVFKRFSVVGIDRLIFTKLDDTSVYGGIYNIMRKTDIPVSYFTSGQRVPEDLEIASKERLVDLILRLSSN